MNMVRKGWKILIILVLLASLLFLNGLIVIYRAEAIASDRPYCIQIVADSRNEFDDYREAESLYDVSPFIMFTMAQPTLGSDDLALSNHGILVLTNPTHLMNWSYWSENFRSEVLNHDVAEERYRPKIKCTPKQHFGLSLLWP